MSTVADPQIAATLDELAGASSRLIDLAVDPTDITDAYAYSRELEAVSRQIRSLQIGFLNAIERSGLHRADGHASPKVMSRHANNLSPAEALRRDKARRMLRAMPLVAAAFAEGSIGPCQVDRITRTYANKRVRHDLEAQDANVAILAARESYETFDRRLTDWERLADEDGAGDRAERSHRDRNFSFHRNFDGSWRIEGGVGALQGAEMDAIHRRFVEREFEADWAEARSRLGNDATVADLRRTDAQRRADAALAAWKAGADTQAGQPGGSSVVTNIIIDKETMERELRRMCGEDPGPDERAKTLLGDAVNDLPLDASDPPGSAKSGGEASSADEAGPRRAGFACCTEDGHPLHPTEAVAAALLGHVRRVVIGANGVTLDMGRLRRLFDGPRRDAVMLSKRRCSWVGCLVPVSDCQADHLVGFNGPKQGSTCPDNGAPLCGRHNRLKERGFTLYRDERGHLHLLRPDGTEIS